MTNYIDLIDSNGNEWTRTSRFREAKETIAAQAVVIEALKEALQKSRSVFDSYVIIHRDKTPPDSEKAARNAFHRAVCDNALTIPTDSTQILEQYVKGKTQAQAAVIEKLREALSVVMWFVPNHPTVPENKRRFDILKEALAIPTDSTQILDEVRRAELERVAVMFEESGIGGDHLAAAIRAKE